MQADKTENQTILPENQQEMYVFKKTKNALEKEQNNTEESNSEKQHLSEKSIKTETKLEISERKFRESLAQVALLEREDKGTLTQEEKDELQLLRAKEDIAAIVKATMAEIEKEKAEILAKQAEIEDGKEKEAQINKNKLPTALTNIFTNIKNTLETKFSSKQQVSPQQSQAWQEKQKEFTIAKSEQNKNN